CSTPTTRSGDRSGSSPASRPTPVTFSGSTPSSARRTSSLSSRTRRSSWVTAIGPPRCWRRQTTTARSARTRSTRRAGRGRVHPTSSWTAARHSTSSAAPSWCSRPPSRGAQLPGPPASTLTGSRRPPSRTPLERALRGQRSSVPTGSSRGAATPARRIRSACWPRRSRASWRVRSTRVGLWRPEDSRETACRASAWPARADVTETMLAAVLPEPGAPLQLEEIRAPTPRHGEALVRVTACGVCHTDLHVIKGEVPFPTPAVLGHEISGTIVEVGEAVDTPSAGDQVVGTFIMPCGGCRACAVGREDLCEKFFELNRLRGTPYDGEARLFRSDGSPLAMYSMGGLAEYAVVPARALFPLPGGVPFEDAAVFGCAAMTAYGAVTQSAELHPGERVVVVAAGGVGSLIVQFARAFGAQQVVAVDVGEEKLEAARSLGATETVDA